MLDITKPNLTQDMSEILASTRENVSSVLSGAGAIFTAFLLQRTSSADAFITVSQTGTGKSGFLFDASDGDFSGDHAVLQQNNDLSVELANLSANLLLLKTAGTTRLAITGAGKTIVGRSTAATAAAALDVVGATSGAITPTVGLHDSASGFASGRGGSIAFSGPVDTPGTVSLFAVIHGYKANSNESNTASGLRFFVRPDAGSLTEVARFDGNTASLIIGTDLTPVAGLKLRVSDTALALVRIHSTDADSSAALQVQNDARTWQMGVNGAAADLWRLRDVTAAQDRITVSSAGAVDLPVSLAIGSGTAITKHLSATTTWDPASVAAGAQATTTVAVAGAALGNTVVVSFSLDLQGMQLTGYVSSAGNVTVVLRNGTAGAIDLGSGTLRADVWQH